MNYIKYFFRRLFHKSKPYEPDELIAKWLEMKKPKGE